MFLQLCERVLKQALNPDWTIHKLTAANLGEYIDVTALHSSIEGKTLPPEALSDVIRIVLLEHYGGIWVDSTVYCLMQLSDWLPEKWTSGFFAFAKPGPDRMLSSWFLAADKNNHIIREWHRATLEYWRTHNERHHYFWFHYLFAQVYLSDIIFRNIWDSTPIVSADEPHHYAPYEKLNEIVTANDLRFIDHPHIPVLKLSHKLTSSKHSNESVLSYLCARANLLSRKKLVSSRENRRSISRKLLIAWYGSFKGHGTIGDLLAMQCIVTHLSGLGHHVFQASAENVNVPGGTRVVWQTVLPEAFDAFIFVCGPILKYHSETQALFLKFQRVRKIGVSVSIFPKSNINHHNPFDEVLAREGAPERYADVSILAPNSRSELKHLRKRHPNIGIVLRGQQSEYGQERCLCEKTERIALEASKEICDCLGGRIIIIENHLSRSGFTPEAIEAEYADCDLVITSRFHGAMIALRNHVPFIAIDQIEGGGKVLNLVGGTFWPYVYEASNIDSDRILLDAKNIFNGAADKILLAVRERAINEANKTLSRLAEIIFKLP